MRKKIHLSIDKSILHKIEFISASLYVSKGIILDNLIEYILKKNLQCSPKKCDRVRLTTTVNPDLWNKFKSYADSNGYKYNSLLEEALSCQYRNLKRKIVQKNR